MLFPLNIWVMEIIQGYGLVWIFGRNVAWSYKGYPDAMFHGNIRTNYLIPWMGLGLGLELLWGWVEGMIDILMSGDTCVYILFLSIPVSILTDRFIGFPALVSPGS